MFTHAIFFFLWLTSLFSPLIHPNSFCMGLHILLAYLSTFSSYLFVICKHFGKLLLCFNRSQNFVQDQVQSYSSCRCSSGIESLSKPFVQFESFIIAKPFNVIKLDIYLFWTSTVDESSFRQYAELVFDVKAEELIHATLPAK